MKLYYSPGACSLAPHIVLREGGFSFSLEKVSLADKKTADGGNYRDINPKGYVPALQLDTGEVLTEVAAIVQYLADKAPEKELAPEPRTMAHYRLVEWLGFISTELHKTFSPLFKPATPEATRQAAFDTLALRIDLVNKELQSHPYLNGNQFSVADAYLFTVLRWARLVKFDLARWPAVQDFLQRVSARPAVRDAMLAEGLIRQ